MKPISRLIAASCLLMGGCAAPEAPQTFEYQSTMPQSTRGLVLHDDGENGHAGMFGTNCPFETRRGSVTGDYDLPDEGEDIQDVGDSHFGDETILAVQPGVLWLMNKETGDYRLEEVRHDRAIAGRLTDDGVVVMSDDTGCHLTWLDGERATVGDQLLSSCEPDQFTVDPSTGTVVIGDEDGAEIVTPDEVIVTGVEGNLVSYDPATQAVYVAVALDDTVQGMELDGTVRWTTVLDGEIHSLSNAGSAGAAAVTVATDDGRGALMYLDGWTGEVVSFVETPGPAPVVTVSGNGRTVAMVLEDEAHFYDLSALRP